MRMLRPRNFSIRESGVRQSLYRSFFDQVHSTRSNKQAGTDCAVVQIAVGGQLEVGEPGHPFDCQALPSLTGINCVSWFGMIPISIVSCFTFIGGVVANVGGHVS